MDVAALVERQAGAGLAPEEDVLRGSLHGARNLPEPGDLLVVCGAAPRIVTCGDDTLAVGAERGDKHRILMLKRRAERLAGDTVPYPRGLVVAGGDDALAVGA